METIKKELTVNNFLDEVYSWLCQSRNRTVEDFHYSASVVMNKKDFKASIKQFITGRLISMNIDLNTLSDNFIDKATNKYIRNMYS